MKVLFVSHYSEMYGANLSMVTLIEELRERHAIEPLVLFPREGELSKELARRNIPCMARNFYYWSQPGGKLRGLPKGLTKLLLNQLAARDVSKRLSKEGIDLVHSNSSVIDFGSLLAKRLQLPHVWHLREFGDLDYSLHFILPKLLVRREFEAASRLVSISKSIAAHFSSIAPNGKFSIIYNGIDTSSFSHEGMKKIPGEVQFVLVGLVQEKKGHWDMVKATDHLIREGIQNFHVHVVGDGRIVALEKDIAEKGLSEKITLHGRRNDVPVLLRGMHVGLMTSHAEAFGRTTVEYQLAGLPVIAAESGAGMELVKNGLNGYLIPPRQPQALALAMKEFCTHPERTIEMGREAQAFVRANFDSRHTTDMIFHMYKEILGRI
ncbi:glycosyltransferase family 4 protein [Hydrogenophaga sp. NFH-34]|uniref:glycosyltransferase family 4 protein n=1 Tax=Hydrogenophaga sp. NFH-34 TaxID=2744446 RepID=UPI001F1F4EAC|nr:glycosyltransferase family 4 protein [Hydrogenophaga sp. NFH-34]